jgi:hypothetical protein
MLVSKQPKAQIIRKNVRTKSGQEMFGVFLIVEYFGELRVKVISLTPINPLGKKDSVKNQYYLPQTKTKNNSCYSYTKKEGKIVSPYKNLLYFVSQLTRGPSL